MLNISSVEVNKKLFDGMLYVTYYIRNRCILYILVCV